MTVFQWMSWENVFFFAHYCQFASSRWEQDINNLSKTEATAETANGLSPFWCLKEVRRLDMPAVSCNSLIPNKKKNVMNIYERQVGSIRTKMKLSFRMSSTFYVNNLKRWQSHKVITSNKQHVLNISFSLLGLINRYWD